MKHPDFSPTYEVERLAQQILNMADERDYWRRQALHYQQMHEEHMQDLGERVDEGNRHMASMLTAALDPNSGINRMVRAVERDPLKGATA